MSVAPTILPALLTRTKTATQRGNAHCKIRQLSAQQCNFSSSPKLTNSANPILAVPFRTATTEQRKSMNQNKPKHENQRGRKTFPTFLTERLPIFATKFSTDKKQGFPRSATPAALGCRTNLGGALANPSKNNLAAFMRRQRAN